MSLTNAVPLPIWASILLNDQSLTAPPATACLVMIAPGTQDPRWREPVERLYATVRRTTSRPLKLAFLGSISPSLADVASECAREGITEMNVLPVFFAAAAHISAEFPEQIRQLHKQFPCLQVNVLAPLAEDRRMFALMCEIVREKIA